MLGTGSSLSDISTSAKCLLTTSLLISELSLLMKWRLWILIMNLSCLENSLTFWMKICSNHSDYMVTFEILIRDSTAASLTVNTLSISMLIKTDSNFAWNISRPITLASLGRKNTVASLTLHVLSPSSEHKLGMILSSMDYVPTV